MKTKKALHGTEYIIEPLTLGELAAIADERGNVTVCVPVDLFEEVLHVDDDSFIDAMSAKVCGDAAFLVWMDYAVVDVVGDKRGVVVQVTSPYEVDADAIGDGGDEG